MASELLPRAKGRARGLRVPEVMILYGRSVGKSTSIAARRFALQKLQRDIASPVTRWKDNLVLKSWSGIVAQQLAVGSTAYRISGMYLEFANVASPGDTAPIPTYDRSNASGRDYYDSLSVSGSRDYLRVPMVAAQIESSDEAEYPDGNVINFFAMSSGVTGIHGKAFGEASNSVVVGGALVAQPVLADATRDIVLSRFYLDEEEQMPKLNTGQVGLEWELELQ